MKPLMIKVFFCFTILFLSTIADSNAQGFNLNDPNLIFKNQKGDIISKDSVIVLAGKGPFSMQQNELPNGKIEVIITPISAEEAEKSASAANVWKSKWLNQPLPEFALQTLQDKSYSKFDLENKYTVINFWFIGCKPCQQEMPELNKLVENYRDKPVVFIAPSLDEAQALNSFSKKKIFKYVILANAKSLTDKMTINSFPTHMILDKEGVIKEILMGASADIYTRLDAAIQKVMSTDK